MLSRRSAAPTLTLVLLGLLVAGCAGKPPVEEPTPPPTDIGARDDRPADDRPPRVADDADSFPPMDTEGGDIDEMPGVIRPGDAIPGLNTVYFAFDSHDLTETTLNTLKDNATTIMANPEWRVRVEGHCDERGTIEYNLELGAKRARAVMDYLISLGVPADRLEMRSYGEERPVDDRKNEAAYSRNRRAEFVAAG